MGCKRTEFALDSVADLLGAHVGGLVNQFIVEDPKLLGDSREPSAAFTRGFNHSVLLHGSETPDRSNRHEAARQGLTPPRAGPCR
jgi:hypothetical protein